MLLKKIALNQYMATGLCNSFKFFCKKDEVVSMNLSYSFYHHLHLIFQHGKETLDPSY